MLILPKAASVQSTASTMRAVATAVAMFALGSTAVGAHEMAKVGMQGGPGAIDHSKMCDMKHTPGMSMTGDVNVDFANNMRMHHQMGVTMARAQIKHSKDAELIRLSRAIITAQNKEIAVLDAWLKAHKQAAGSAAPHQH